MLILVIKFCLMTIMKKNSSELEESVIASIDELLKKLKQRTLRDQKN